MVVDKTGSTAGISRHDYLPFGEEIFAGTGGRTAGQGYTANDGVRQQFTRKERDVETGLDYFLARYYSSTQGRFTSPDELLADQLPHNPQSWNLYSYVRNNPLRTTDPDGRMASEEGDFLEKLHNWYAGWGYRTDKEVQEELIRRAEWLQHLQAEIGALYIRPINSNGSWEYVNVWSTDPRYIWGMYEVIRDKLERGKLQNDLTPEEAADAVNSILAPTAGAPGRKPAEPRFKTDAEAAKKAKDLGFTKINERVHGQAVFKRGNTYITRDVDGHSGGAWKVAKSVKDLASKATRSGTYNENLKKIAK
jgi:RHS repeat-associated protein